MLRKEQIKIHSICFVNKISFRNHSSKKNDHLYLEIEFIAYSTIGVVRNSLNPLKQRRLIYFHSNVDRFAFILTC